MLKRLGFLLLVILFAPQASAGEISDGDRQAIRAVIEDQLGAFQRDDAAGAFAHASPSIQRQFQNPTIFMEMVRIGYPPVYRPRHVEFRDIVDVDGVPTQRVLLVAPDGTPVIALYPMERQADGTWRIDGCFLVRADGDMV